ISDVIFMQKLLKAQKKKNSDGDKLDYNCVLGYASRIKIIYKCSGNNWIKWRGEKCSPKRCELPEDRGAGQGVIVEQSNRGPWRGRAQTLIKNKGSKRGFSQQCHRRIILGSLKNLSVSCDRNTTEENIRKKITCQTNGEWSSPFPKCVEATCPLQVQSNLEKIIIFSCTGQGLILKEQREITCQSNVEWSSPFPKCDEAIWVAKLTENMRSDEHPGSEVSIRPGHTITLSCVGSGSTLLGQNKITCQSNGEWSNPFPKCEGKCGPPEVSSKSIEAQEAKLCSDKGNSL
uniref:Sushi domain-containing protein n=1 Tax=Sinocyclocheilus anshuiensis TaxID=1608454 RepID=A0A671R6M9_9TELE